MVFRGYALLLLFGNDRNFGNELIEVNNILSIESSGVGKYLCTRTYFTRWQKVVSVCILVSDEASRLCNVNVWYWRIWTATGFVELASWTWSSI